VSVTREHRVLPCFNGQVGPDGAYLRREHTSARPRTQDLADLVVENGAVYAFTRAHWERTGSRMGGDCRALVMHWAEAVDIDEPEDLEAARRLAR
jgi:CMP-N-acetylneuraminic acid synthetase